MNDRPIDGFQVEIVTHMHQSKDHVASMSTPPTRGMSILLAALLLHVSSLNAEDRVPDFSYSRPSGPKQLLAPLPHERPAVPSVKFGVFRPFNPIDHFILKRLQDEKVRPQKLCDDWDFARRSSIDLVGVIPTVDDLDTYFRWKPPERRAKWIDLLLKQKQYADHWTVFWGDMLRERGRILGAPENALKKFIHDALARNRPYDEWVRELIVAEGSPIENPAAAFILQDRGEADVLTVSVSESLLGVRLRCAQCHDHPFDWWTKQDFDGMAGFWQGTRMKRAGDENVTLPDGRVITLPRFEVTSRKRGESGVFLTGANSFQGRGRDALADLITQRKNPYFARVLVNRLWEKLMGTGLVNPSSNFTPLNPPSHPELLDWLAIEFIESGYDIKHMLRLMALSRTYQQSTVDSTDQHATLLRRNRQNSPEESDLLPGSLFEGMPLRRMTAEQINDSILVATGRYRDVQRRFQRAIDVTYPPNSQSFLRVFGASDRETISPRPAGGSIQQMLTLLNGDFLNSAVRFHDDHPLHEWSTSRGMGVGQMVDALYAQILTRQPTRAEKRAAMAHVGNGTFDELWEDLQWALINTREFQFVR